MQASRMFLPIFFLLVRLTTSTTCWTATGQIAPNDQPCFPENAKHSLCCPPGSICSANKLCILPPAGQPHCGSCTDRTWGSWECPHFCLSEHTGGDGLTGVNMTVCRTDRTTTSYCCNDWVGRRCDCSDENTPTVILNLFEPLAKIPAQEEEGDGGTLNDIPWGTVGPVLVAGMTLGILGMLLYVTRMTYIAKQRGKGARRDSIVEGERRFSDFFWNPSLEEKVRGNSKFSIGTVDTEEGEMDRKLSVKSVRFSIGRRSRSEGSQVQNGMPIVRTETPPPMFRSDIFTKRPSRPSLTGAAEKGLPKLVVGRPTFRRQDTDLGVVADARKGEVDAGLGGGDMLRVPGGGRVGT